MRVRRGVFSWLQPATPPLDATKSYTLHLERGCEELMWWIMSVARPSSICWFCTLLLCVQLWLCLVCTNVCGHQNWDFGDFACICNYFGNRTKECAAMLVALRLYLARDSLKTWYFILSGWCGFAERSSASFYKLSDWVQLGLEAKYGQILNLRKSVVPIHPADVKVFHWISFDLLIPLQVKLEAH